jgi:AAA+ superfamily predicted ATPase
MDDVWEFDRALEALVTVVSRAGSAKQEPQPSMLPQRARQLQHLFALTDDEIGFVWVCAAHSQSFELSQLAASQFGQHARRGVAVGHHETWHGLKGAQSRALLAMFEQRHPVHRFALLTVIADGEQSSMESLWQISPHIANFLQGNQGIDAQLMELGSVRHANASDLLLSTVQQEQLNMLCVWAHHADPTSPVVVISGPHGSGRSSAVAAAVGSRGILAIDYARVPANLALAILQAQFRSAIITETLPVLCNLDELFDKFKQHESLATARFALVSALRHAPSKVAVTITAPALELNVHHRAVMHYRWPLPDAATRELLWRELLGDSVVSDQHIGVLATRYAMGPGGINDALVAACNFAKVQRDYLLAVDKLEPGQAKPTPRLTFDSIVTGVQNNISEKLTGLASRIVVTQEWNDLVVSQDTTDDLVGLLARAKNAHHVLDQWGFRQKLARGSGIAALFSGPPGTGKTMVAGLIARDLELELYQVDLSNIVSKWVGETEKQLSKLFDAAEAGHALLLFDEADSLFAKRSADVKSATDRYANLEVNYLLQRIESFGGFVILTTNLDNSMDPALRRRLAAHIVFAAPETPERAKLWRDMVTTKAGAPLAPNIDYHSLAEDFRDMTGSNIRNAAIAAAFRASADSSMITEAHLRQAATTEYRSMGRVLSKQRSTIIDLRAVFHHVEIGSLVIDIDGDALAQAQC